MSILAKELSMMEPNINGNYPYIEISSSDTTIELNSMSIDTDENSVDLTLYVTLNDLELELYIICEFNKINGFYNFKDYQIVGGEILDYHENLTSQELEKHFKNIEKYLKITFN